MEVRTEAVTGAAGVPDHLSLADGIAEGDDEAALVGVTGGEPAAVVDAGVVAVAAAFGLRLLQGDGAGRGGADRGPFRDGDVDPRVVLVAGADVAAAEARGDRPGDGPDQAAAAFLDRSGGQ